MDAKIVVKDFNLYYGKKQAIEGFNLSIPRNEIFSLFGPAGSGITSLLRAMNRLSDLTPDLRTEGDILLDGESVFAPDLSVTALRRRVGMVFDVPTPLPLSIFENIAYGPRLQSKKSKAELRDVAEQALRAAALWEDVKDRLLLPAMSLSGGQQQRLCIARVLALQPEVILLDRPCSGLDPISTAKIEESLIELKKNLTVVIAPHSTQQAGRIADRVAFMLMGKLIEDGTSEEVFTQPKDQRTNDYITGRFG